MECPKCGAENFDDAAFCTLCMTRFETAQEAEEPFAGAVAAADPEDAAPAYDPWKGGPDVFDRDAVAGASYGDAPSAEVEPDTAPGAPDRKDPSGATADIPDDDTRDPFGG
jgi:hypothetical protein